MTKRKPAVAGQFYPGSAREIDRALERLIDPAAAKPRAIGAMAPHAGWIYSGRCAGLLYGRIELPERVVVMCPNHRGAGADAAIMLEGAWEMPGGDVALDSELGRLIMDRTDLITEDERAHRHEHSLEVHLPFLQRLRPGFLLTPISLGRVSFDECEEIGRALAAAVAALGQEVLVVASSDMTHFESAEAARAKDRLALDRIVALDPKGLHDVVLKNHITMCGVIPATIMLLYALERGAKQAEIVDYRNSGDVTGDHADVVAYASALVK